MRLTAVEIQGFKSFAESIRLEFNAGITAVIGPNGSGKSNIADAIRWVLGEQSSKMLRGKERTDVIFSGSTSRGGARRATVRLTFDNESGRFPIDAGEIVISRTLSVDGESEYSINGEPVRLVDLQQMLAEAGIGAKSYTVISQGMVDRYLTATPEGRRELFDEATGIRALQIKMNQAEKKLRATEHHEQELAAIMRELEPRLAVLRRQIEREEKRVVLQKEFDELQAQWFTATWHTRNRTREQTQALLETTKEHVGTARFAREQVEMQLVRAASGNTPPDQLVLDIQRARAEYDVKKTEYERIVNQRQQLETSIEDIRSQRTQAETELNATKEDSLHFDWLQQTRTILAKCRSLLQSFLSGNANTEEATSLLSSIESMLEKTDDSMSVNMARSVLDQIEKPLQEVARLTAIEQERTEQLKRLPTVTPPDPKPLLRLEKLLEERGSVASETSPPEQELHHVREAELTAEREHSAALASAEQARQEMQSLEQEILREKGSAFLSQIQHSSFTGQEAPSMDTIRTLHGKLSALGEIDPLARKEYEETKERYEHLLAQMQDIEETKRNIVKLQSELSTRIRDNFEQQFTIIQKAFSEYFIRLFGGGSAKLSIVEEGIDISVTPPGKKSRHVTLLSGGERALTSLALLFATLHAQQPPFIVLDEVDAALDESNSSRLAQIIYEKSEQTQCIVITHNRETMSEASVLYGVTMHQDGVSKVYSVKLSDVQEAETPTMVV